jgi:hypothetical protein
MISGLTRPNNIYQVPCIYTSKNRETYLPYLDAELIQKALYEHTLITGEPTDTQFHGELLKGLLRRYETSTYEIVSTDPDASIVDLDFQIDFSNQAAVSEVYSAFRSLQITDQDLPVDFDDREIFPEIHSLFQEILADNRRHQIGDYLLDLPETEQIISDRGLDERSGEVLKSLIGNMNARLLTMLNPGLLVGSYLLRDRMDQPNIVTYAAETPAGGKTLVPLNADYIEAWLKKAHIIGAKSQVIYGDDGLSHEQVAFFDLDRINTKRHVGDSRKKLSTLFGGLACLASSMLESSPAAEGETRAVQEFRNVLSQPYAKPPAIVAVAKQIGSFGELFEADTGNWEGFTLEQHTTTVLSNFDENYADKLPVELLPLQRLALLVHDLGKPLAAAIGDKDDQRRFNETQARDFMERVGIEDKLIELVIAMITNGEKLAYNITQETMRQPREQAEQRLADFSQSVMNQFFAPENAPGNEVKAFGLACKILHICDGGAWTDMATTKLPEATIRNYPSFNETFAPRHGLGGRQLKLPFGPPLGW